jgi:putative ABC transport system permease protein
MALSLDRWLRDRIYYQAGAGYALHQGIDPLAGGFREDQGHVPAAPPTSSWLLPISDYLEIPGVTRATRVGEYPVTPRLPDTSRSGHFLGIDRLDFPAVAYFRSDLAQLPLGELMNRLAMHPDGLLVPRSYLAAHSLVESQRLDMDVDLGPALTRKVSFTVVGTFDYFPTVYPGKVDAFVGNLDYFYEQVEDIYPYDVWLQVQPGADTSGIAARVTQMGAYVISVRDAGLMMAQDEDRIERVGLFGVLSIGFLAGSLLSGVGLLVYTYASLRRRVSEMSLLRAMGAQTTSVLRAVGVEYSAVILYGVVCGVGVGVAASYLYVPFFQFSSDASLAVPPFLPGIAWQQIGWLAVIFAAALAVSQLAILYRVTRQNLFEAMRLGQRE